MAEQKRTAETHDEKLRPREPKQEAAAREAARQGTFAAPDGGPFGPPDDIPIRALAARLGDTRFQTAQRQAMADRIRRVSGNQYLQRAVAQARHGEAVGDAAGAQRGLALDVQPAEDIAAVAPSPAGAAPPESTRRAPRGAQEVVQRYIPARDLPAWGTAEQTAFMRRVYQIQRQRAARRRSFVGELPRSQLAEIEGGVRARRDAAAACRALLQAARGALAEQRRSRDRLARQVRSIGVRSGYRSARRQFQNWSSNFARYYRQTQADRARLRGGEHGAAAAGHLARYISGRLASPGYSLHNSGVAIDFETRQGRHNLGPSTSQIALWNRSWLFRWLSANARNFGFAQNPSINEPWHWELVVGVEVIQFSEAEGTMITAD